MAFGLYENFCCNSDIFYIVLVTNIILRNLMLKSCVFRQRNYLSSLIRAKLALKMTKRNLRKIWIFKNDKRKYFSFFIRLSKLTYLTDQTHSCIWRLHFCNFFLSINYSSQKNYLLPESTDGVGFHCVFPKLRTTTIRDSFRLDPICVTLFYWHVCLCFSVCRNEGKKRRKQITWLSQVLVLGSHSSFRAPATEALPMRHSLRTRILIKLLCLMWVSALTEFLHFF